MKLTECDRCEATVEDPDPNDWGTGKIESRALARPTTVLHFDLCDVCLTALLHWLKEDPNQESVLDRNNVPIQIGSRVMVWGEEGPVDEAHVQTFFTLEGDVTVGVMTEDGQTMVLPIDRVAVQVQEEGDEE